MPSPESLFARRTLNPLGVDTPLLVPSFSSRGFPGVSAIVERMRSEVGRVALVSAFDLHHGSLPADAVRMAQVVLIDSGGYESNPVHDLSEPYLDERPRRPWKLDDYQRVLASLPADGLFAVISFDAPGDLASQIEEARGYLAGSPHATIFLCKPLTPQHRWIPLDELDEAIGELPGFSALGVTEKELGPSPLERCRAVVRLRRAISAAAQDLPIHVLGCLTPLSMLSYFLCGADMFDGLAWLRYSFTGGLATYGAEVAIANGDGAISDVERRTTQATANLRFLRRLAQAMQRYCERPDVEVLAAVPGLERHVLAALRLAIEAGATIEEMGRG